MMKPEKIKTANQLINLFFSQYIGFTAQFIYDGKIIKGKIKGAKITQNNAILMLNHLKFDGQIEIRSYSINNIKDFKIVGGINNE